MSRADRHTLSPEEIQRELAQLLATGYLRLLADATRPDRSSGADDEELVRGEPRRYELAEQDRFEREERRALEEEGCS